MREALTTALDALGLALVAAGAAGGLWALVGPASLLAAGLVLLGGSWWAATGAPRRAMRRLDRAQREAVRR